MEHECFKCNRLIDEILNIDDREDTGQFIYICETCAEIGKDKGVGVPDKSANQVIDDLGQLSWVENALISGGKASNEKYQIL